MELFGPKGPEMGSDFDPNLDQIPETGYEFDPNLDQIGFTPVQIGQLRGT